MTAKPARERLSETELRVFVRGLVVFNAKDLEDIQIMARECLRLRRALRKVDRLLGTWIVLDRTKAMEVIARALASPLAATKGGR